MANIDTTNRFFLATEKQLLSKADFIKFAAKVITTHSTKTHPSVIELQLEKLYEIPGLPLYSVSIEIPITNKVDIDALIDLYKTHIPSDTEFNKPNYAVAETDFLIRAADEELPHDVYLCGLNSVYDRLIALEEVLGDHFVTHKQVFVINLKNHEMWVM